MTVRCAVPLIGFCACSRTGKTTLLGKLIPLMKRRGLKTRDHAVGASVELSFT
jgi:molybdopterin-guanine dinucleotide biosynthesis protein